MADQPRSGIIGTGLIAAVHAKAVHAAGGVLAAVAGRTAQSSAAAVPRFRAERGLTVEELIASPDVDVVHICTPNHVHEPVALAALAAGRHVICEKPLATTLAGAQRLGDAARASDRVTAVPFVYRFYPSVRDARARIARGDAGALHLLHGSYLQDWLARPEDDNWRVDPVLGGVSRAFADIGVHWCDLVEFVTGHRIVELSARLLTALSRPGTANAAGTATSGTATEDIAVVNFSTDRGAVGSVVVSQVTHGRKNRLWFSLDGADASFSFDQELPDALWIGGRDANLTVPRGGTATTEAAQRYNTLPAGHPQGYQDCFNAFVADVYAAMAGARPDGLPSFEDGLRAARLTDAVLAASASATWVPVA